MNKAENLSLIIETTSKILELGIRLLKLSGRISILELKHESNTSSEKIYEFEDYETSLCNEIATNLLVLLNVSDKETISICDNNIKAFKEALNSFPNFKKIEKPTRVIKLEEQYIANKPNDSSTCWCTLVDVFKILYK